MVQTFHPLYLGDQQSTIASILYGEAGGQGPMGMQAVYNVMANRAAANYGGYGTDVLSQALAGSQFQGQGSATNQGYYSSSAYSIAGQGLNGQLTDVTGGATQYANPLTSTPGNWGSQLNSGNSLQIGAHYFTDNTSGQPFALAGQSVDPTQPVSLLSAQQTLPAVNPGADMSNWTSTPSGGLYPAFVSSSDPIYSGVLPTTQSQASQILFQSAINDGGAPGTFTQAQLDAAGQLVGTGGSLDTSSTLTGNGLTPMVEPGYTIGSTGDYQTGTGVDSTLIQNAGSPYDYSSGDLTSPSGITGSLAVNNSNPYTIGSTADMTAGSSVDPSLMQSTSPDLSSLGGEASSGAAGPGVATDTSGSTPPTSKPPDQTVPQAIDAQTQRMGQDTAAINKTTQQTTNATDTTATGLVASFETWATNIFVRAGVIVLGMICIGFGLAMLFPKQTKAVFASARDTVAA